MFFKKAKVIELAKTNQTETELFVRMLVEDYDSSTFILVDETHVAVLIKDGELQETLGYGKHPITINKKDTAKLEVVFIPKTTKMKMYWGTRNQFDFRDPIEDVLIKVGANGEVDVQIATPRKFFLELVGTKQNFSTDDLKEKVHGKLVMELEKIIADIMKRNKLSYDRMEENKSEISRLVKMEISKVFEREFGLKVVSFVINGIIIPKEHLDNLLEARSLREKIENKKQKEKLTQIKIKEEKINLQEKQTEQQEVEEPEERKAMLIGEDEE